MARLREPEGPPRKPRGRPFRQGFDERRHAGRAPNPMTAALRELVAEGGEQGIDDLKEVWRTGIARAKAGDLGWATLMAAYLDGKPVARQEQGGPGDFGRPDFSDLTTDELREYIRVLRGGRDADPKEE